MKVEQREIVLIDYYFSDLKETKLRPAMVVSNNFLNSLSQDCLMIPLTTVLKNVFFSIEISQQDMVSGKLKKTSRARADKIFAMKKELIITKLGKVNESTFNLIKKEIVSMF